MNFLLAGNKFMSELYLGLLKLTYSVCRPFTKTKENNKKINKTGDSRKIYQNKLDKTCFQHGMTYGDFKDLLRGTTFDKALCQKVSIMLKTPEVMDINLELLQWFLNLLIKKFEVVVSKMTICQTKN